MALTRLSLSDFRNHAQFVIEPMQDFVVLHGPNGAGKTNILEAVSMLVPGRGLRRAALAEMARSNGLGGFSIAAQLGDIHIGTGTEAASPERRKVRINGANASINSLSEWLAVLWLTPAMDRLFSEGSGGRRRFVDRLVLALHAEHARYSSRYEAAMRERNRLLADDNRPDPAWLDAIEARMAEAASNIVRARAGMIEQLDNHLAGQADDVFAIPQLALGGLTVAESGDLTEIWREGRARDAAAGRTLAGPHRSDLVVQHRKKAEDAARCSTGEQKAMLLSIILAHARLVAQQRGEPPILLLDEVAAHLDPERRKALFNRLAQVGGQVWMTGTEAGLFEAAGPDAQLVGLGS